MKYNLRILLSIVFFIITSCNPLQKDKFNYTAEIYLYNTSNQTVKIQTDNTDESKPPIYLTKNQYCCLTQSRRDDYTSVENIPIESFYLKSYVEVYSVPDNKLLKKWTYEERNNDGKQFFRLSDHRYTIKQNNYLMTVCFKFHITDEDLQNQL